MQRSRARSLRCCSAVALALAGALTHGCAVPPARATATAGGDLATRGELLLVPAGVVHVVICTSHECPIANSYAPTLRELAAGWADDRGEASVRLFIVHVDPDLTAAAAAEHALAFGLPGAIRRDPSHDVVSQLGFRRTPEAAVITTAGCVYRGRIDDQWHALGARSAAATRHDLRDAVALARAGRPVPAAGPEPVGCLLPEPRRQASER